MKIRQRKSYSSLVCHTSHRTIRTLSFPIMSGSTTPNKQQYLLNYDRVQGNGCLCSSFYRSFPPYDIPIKYFVAAFSGISLADYMRYQIYAKYYQFLLHCHFPSQGFLKLILVCLCTFYLKCMSYLVLAYALTDPRCSSHILGNRSSII